MVEKIQGWKAEMENRARIKQSSLVNIQRERRQKINEGRTAKEREQAIREFVEPKEKKILRKTREKVVKEDKATREARELRRTKLIKVREKKGKITTKRVSMGRYRREMVARVFRSKSEKKAVAKRAKATRGVLAAMGIIQGKQTYGGAGRPRGTFKYGMPIHIYKQKLRERKALYQRYQDEQYAKLRPRGFTPEQIQQLQQQQAIREMQQPIREEEMEEGMDVQEMQQIPQEYQETQQIPIQQQIPTQMPQVQQKQRYGRIIPRSQQIRPGRSVADDELDFRQWSAEQTVSPRTQRVLDTIRRIQNKGKTDNIEQQRRHRERQMVSDSTNLLKAHENMIDNKMDFTGTEDNILSAPNIWKENQDNNIMSKRRNILDTQSFGNNLKFF